MQGHLEISYAGMGIFLKITSKLCMLRSLSGDGAGRMHAQAVLHSSAGCSHSKPCALRSLSDDGAGHMHAQAVLRSSAGCSLCSGHDHASLALAVLESSALLR